MGRARNWRATLSKRTRAVIQVAESQGWGVDCTANGHVRFRSPEGEVVIGSSAGRTELDQHFSRMVKRLRSRGLRIDA